MTTADVARALHGRRNGAGWLCRCPVPGHGRGRGDRTPSLSVDDREGGRLLVHCHAGCSQPEIIAALRESGLWNGAQSQRPQATAKRLPGAGADAPRRERRPRWHPIQPVPFNTPAILPPHRLGHPSAVWDYPNAEGRLLFRVARFEPPDGSKQVIPLSWCGNGEGSQEWRWQAPPQPAALYGLDRLAAQPGAPVLVVEGEKTADAVVALFPEYIAVTSQGGCKAAAKTDWSPLANRHVVVWPDNDQSGRNYSEDVCRLLRAAGAASVAVVSVPTSFPDCWDLADALPEGWTSVRLHNELLAKAAPWQAPEPSAASAGEHGIASRCMADVQPRPVRWLWPGRIARGKVTLIAGHPGLGKSQVATAFAAIVTTGGCWPADGKRAEVGSAIFMTAEDDAEDTLRPRLEAAGADLRRVHLLEAVREETERGKVRERAFNFADDLARLDSFLATIPDAALLVVDPITAYLGTIDSHINAEVRAVLAPLSTPE